MSYHMTNLGSFAGHVSRYADIQGYVPEPGDSPEDFSWDGGEPPYDWDKHIEEALKATRIANASAARWSGSTHGELCRMAIGDAGLTQADVAKKMGLSQPSLAQRMMSDRVSVDTVEGIARAIGWTIPEIIGE